MKMSSPLCSRSGHDECDNWRRAELLAATANDILSHTDPKIFLQLLFDRLSGYCGLEVCFSYWVAGSRLRLAFASGITPEIAAQIEWLEFGQAICGMAAAQQCRITAEDIQHSKDARAALVRSMGVQAYCCHPLIACGKLLGTLSYGTRKRPSFTDADVALMRAVSDQVAVALERFLFVQELTRKNTELERAMGDLRHFAYAVSHDLQEPVRTMASYSELLARKLGNQLGEDEREILGYLRSGAVRLDSLLKALLAYSQAADGEAPHEELDLRRAAEEAIAACRSSLEDYGAHVTLEVPALRLRANAVQLSQVFQNLLSNAVRYSRQDEPPRIRIVAQRDRDELLVSVEDNGQGIERRHLDKVFQLFKRLHGPTVPGTGIGLATSRRIIERHGGRMWVESTPGVGSIFHFTLPLASAASAAAA